MKTTSVSLSLAALLLAAACNQTATTESPSPGTSQALVTIEGANPAKLSAALLALSEVEILADGKPVAASIERANADLAKAGEKLSLRFAVPALASRIEVRVGFDEFGGYDSRNGHSGEIDARGTGIRFDADADELARSGQAVIRLDLERSIVETRAEHALLLPHYELQY
jgi:hypothetical protein